MKIEYRADVQEIIIKLYEESGEKRGIFYIDKDYNISYTIESESEFFNIEQLMVLDSAGPYRLPILIGFRLSYVNIRSIRQAIISRN